MKGGQENHVILYKENVLVVFVQCLSDIWRLVKRKKKGCMQWNKAGK
jgi:hypothetical protein